MQVWKYSETDKIADGVLEKIHVDVQTPEGLTETDALLMGGANGSLRYNETAMWCNCACISWQLCNIYRTFLNNWGSAVSYGHLN